MINLWNANEAHIGRTVGLASIMNAIGLPTFMDTRELHNRPSEFALKIGNGTTAYLTTLSILYPLKRPIASECRCRLLRRRRRGRLATQGPSGQLRRDNETAVVSEQAVAAVWDYLRNEKGSPCVVLPTGSGKTPVIAEMCRQVLEWGGRVVVLAHVKELLAQAADKLRRFVNPDDIGLYSAGLNERTTDKPIVVAGIQSV